MQTSNFRISGKNPKAVAISRGIPPWYTGARLIELAPSRVLMQVKDDTEYNRRYKAEVLAGLDPQDIIEALEPESILLCWENPGEPCHRRLVAEWLEKELGIEVPEFEPKKKEPPQGKLEM